MIRSIATDVPAFGAARDCIERDPAMIKTAVMACVIKDVLIGRFTEESQHRLCNTECHNSVFEEAC